MQAIRSQSLVFRMLFIVAMLAIVNTSTLADVVTDWNEAAVNGGQTIIQKFGSMPAARVPALVHLAQFETANGIRPSYKSYVNPKTKAPADADMELAMTAAAHKTMALMFPTNPALYEELYQKTAKKIGAEAKSSSVAYGEAIAQEVFDLRKTDGVDTRDSYRPQAPVGKYVSTAHPIGSFWPATKPWTLTSTSQFRPGPPPSLQSAEYTRDLNEVKDYGRVNSSMRTKEQTEVAQFWRATGPTTYAPIARQLIVQKGMGLVDGARLMALLSMATTDAYLAVFDAKYEYQLWRPVTAIRNADRDDNPNTERDAAWEALIEVPLHPEYPCAHCIVSNTAMGILAREFGDKVNFSMKSLSLPNVTRNYTSLSDYANEIRNARVWAGVHYRFSTEVGAEMAAKIAQQAWDKHLTPLK